MQYTIGEFSGQPVSTVNRVGLAILVILFFPLMMLMFVFLGDQSTSGISFWPVLWWFSFLAFARWR